MRYKTIEIRKRRQVILDTKSDRAICTCRGWSGRDNADLICKALNEYSEPIEKLLDADKFEKFQQEAQDITKDSHK